MTHKDEAVRLYELFYYQLPTRLSTLSRDLMCKTFAKFVIEEKLNEGCINQHENEVEYLKGVLKEIDLL